MNIGGRQYGKSRAGEIFVEAALDCGHKVMVVNRNGAVIKKRYSSGLTSITPVKR